MKDVVYSLNIKTCTLDNGIEFQRHTEIGCTTYFCHPYSSWEKGSIENMNRLIRRYIPKKTRIKDYPSKYIQDITLKLNHTPRKCLNFSTPHEVFFDQKEKDP